jgi:hypothetical protein
MFNKLKTMIFGGKPDKERRRLARVGDVPKLGSHITKQRGVMKVTVAMQPDLWDWLVLLGWREIDLKTNRRAVTKLSETSFFELAKASMAEREEIHNRIIRQIKTGQ